MSFMPLFCYAAFLFFSAQAYLGRTRARDRSARKCQTPTAITMSARCRRQKREPRGLFGSGLTGIASFAWADANLARVDSDRPLDILDLDRPKGRSPRGRAVP
jgi:hypothetical protein